MSPEMTLDLQMLAPEMWLTATIVIALVADLVWGHRGRQLVALVCLFGTGLALAALFDAPLVEPGARALGVLTLDGHAMFFRALALGGCFLTVLYGAVFRGLDGTTRNEFYPMVLSGGLGACLLVSTDNLLMLMLGMEMLSLPSYIMAGWQKQERRSAEAAMKYLVYGALSSGLMIFGFSLLYGLSGSLWMSDIAAGVGAYLASGAAGVAPSGAMGALGADGGVLLIVATVLVMAGFGFKVAIFPFHFWAPDVYEGAPTPVTTFLAVTSKAAGFGVLVRFVDGVFLGEGVTSVAAAHDWTLALSSVVAVLAAVTMTYGNITAVAQRNVKRLLAYSSIAHAGYLLMGIAVMTAAPGGEYAQVGSDALLFYMATYYLATLGAFGAAMYLANRFGAEDTDDYKGLGWSAPWIGGTMVVFLVSLTGLPPTIGFIGKLWLFRAALDAGLAWLAVVAALNAVVSLFYYFKIVRALFLRGDTEVVEGLDARGLLPRVATVSLGVLALATVVLTFSFDGLATWVKSSLL